MAQVEPAPHPQWRRGRLTHFGRHRLCDFPAGPTGRGTTMRYTWLLLSLLLIVASSGCPRKPPTGKTESADPTEYARATKQAVLGVVTVAKESPKSAAGQAEGLLERLQAAPERLTGDNKPIYEELTRKCKELVDAAKRGSAEVGKLADQMAALAN